MIFLLDTSALMRGESRIASWFASIREDDQLVICTIGRGEILFGFGRLPEGRRRSELEAKAQDLFVALRCEANPPTRGRLLRQRKAFATTPRTFYR